MQIENKRQVFAPAMDASPVVANATSAQRAKFLTKTYLHLLGAIIAFFMLEMVWFSTPIAGEMLNLLVSGGRFGWLLFMAAFVGVSMLADHWARSETSMGKQYAGLGLFTFFESLVFVPPLAMAAMASAGPDGDASILPKAIAITLTLFGGLTGVVFLTRKDFSFLRSALMFGGFAAMGLAVASVVFNFALGMIFSYAMVALACGYILYDTSNMMQRYRTTQHVAASLALFSAVMLLFWYVLRILLDRRR